jgi:hypothetical protein
MKLILLVLFLAFPSYADPVFTSCNVSNSVETLAGVTSSVVLPTNIVRKCLVVVNKGALGSSPIYVTFDGGQQGVTTMGIPVPPGGSWEPVTPPVNAIWATSPGGYQPILMSEGR